MSFAFSDLPNRLPNPPTPHQTTAVLSISTVALSLFAIASTIWLFLEHAKAADRYLSTRQRAPRKKLVALFLGLALWCFFVFSCLKWADAGARGQVYARVKGEGGDGSGYSDGHLEGWSPKREGGDFRTANVGQTEVPVSMPGGFHINIDENGESMYRPTWLSIWVPDSAAIYIDHLGDVLAQELPPHVTPADYWWSTDYWLGALTWIFFLSYQTRLRGLSWVTPLFFTFLTGIFTLSGTQCLLYALMIMSPVRDANMDRWAPNQAFVLAPLWLHVSTWALFGSDFLADVDSGMLMAVTGFVAYTAFVALAWVDPRYLGQYHATPSSARRSRSLTFALMAIPLLLVRIFAAGGSLIGAANQNDSHAWWHMFHLMPKKSVEESLEDVEEAARSTFGMLADTGRANAMAWDVVFSVIVIALWAALAEANPRTMFRSSLLPWLKDEDEVAYEQQERAANANRAKKTWLETVKQLASVENLTRFARPNEAPTTGTAETYVRKRGRPPKHRKSESYNESGYALASSNSKSRSPGSGAKRGPGRPRKSVSPSKRTASRPRSQSRARSQVRQSQHGWKHSSSLGITINGWEAAGVTWCLAVMGGLGVAVMAAFGAEATDLV